MNIQEWNACAYYQKGDTVLYYGVECDIELTGIGYPPPPYKAQAAIKTMEQLGYNYKGGGYWEPPVNIDGPLENWHGMNQRERNYVSALSMEWAANHYSGRDDITTTCTTCTKQKNDIIREYLDAQQTEYK